MYNMSMDDILLIAKIFAYVMGDTSITLTNLDKNAAKLLIKRLVDNRYDWTPEQRELFKMFTDSIINESIRL